MQVQLFTTSACHLCELAETLVLPLCAEFGWSLEKIEIADSDSLLGLYGVRIPVIAVAGANSDLGWPFDSGQLKVFLLGQFRG